MNHRQTQFYFWSATKPIWMRKGKLTLTEWKGSFFKWDLNILLLDLPKRIGVSLFEVSAKTGINCDEAFVELATVMRDKLLASGLFWEMQKIFQSF
jgi:hypothetical protein